MFVAIACEPSAKLPVANCRLAEETIGRVYPRLGFPEPKWLRITTSKTCELAKQAEATLTNLTN